MNEFSNLLNNLLLTSSKKKKIKLLCDFFNNSDLKDKGWAFCILTNRFEKKIYQFKRSKALFMNKLMRNYFSIRMIMLVI